MFQPTVSNHPHLKERSDEDPRPFFHVLFPTDCGPHRAIKTQRTINQFLSHPLPHPLDSPLVAVHRLAIRQNLLHAEPERLHAMPAMKLAKSL